MTTPKIRKFAQDTSITQDRTISDIRAVLKRRGTDGFMMGDKPGLAVIGFEHSRRVYRFDLPMPAIEDFRLTPTGTTRGDQAVIKAWTDECNRRFRALLATIKGRMVAVDEGMSTFEEEFALESVLADGKTTVRQYVLPQLDAAYATGKMPPLLPAPAARAT